MRLITSILLTLVFITSAYSSELTFEFDSPSFSGKGKSSHYLTIENIEKTRKDAIKAANKAAADKATADAKTMYLGLMVYNKTQEHLHHQLVVKWLLGLLQQQVQTIR